MNNENLMNYVARGGWLRQDKIIFVKEKKKGIDKLKKICETMYSNQKQLNIIEYDTAKDLISCELEMGKYPRGGVSGHIIAQLYNL